MQEHRDIRSYATPKVEFPWVINYTNMQSSSILFKQYCYNMHCVSKTENESGILGELQDDSASVKDLSCCPEDMTVTYADMGMMTGSHILQTLLRQSVPHPTRGHLRER